MSEPIELTVTDILGVSAGLSALDGYNKVTEKETAVVSYSFDDSTRWNIGKNKRILRAELDVFEETRVALIKELSPTTSNIAAESPEVQEQFNIRYKELMKRKVPLPGLLKLKKSSLLCESKNPIPGSVLERLIPIIEE